MSAPRRLNRSRRAPPLAGRLALIAFAAIFLYTIVMIAVRHGAWQTLVVIALVVMGATIRDLARRNRPW